MKIRSRIWNGDEMTYPDTISNCEKYSILLDGTIFYHDDEESGTEQPDDISLLSTGLKDKNGQEIFDGDVIEVTYPIDETEKFRLDYRELEWLATSLKEGDTDSINLMADLLTYKIEVIGNVYESPELIEE